MLLVHLVFTLLPDSGIRYSDGDYDWFVVVVPVRRLRLVIHLVVLLLPLVTILPIRLPAVVHTLLRFHTRCTFVAFTLVLPVHVDSVGGSFLDLRSSFTRSAVIPRLRLPFASRLHPHTPHYRLRLHTPPAYLRCHVTCGWLPHHVSPPHTCRTHHALPHHTVHTRYRWFATLHTPLRTFAHLRYRTACSEWELRLLFRGWTWPWHCSPDLTSFRWPEPHWKASELTWAVTDVVVTA